MFYLCQIYENDEIYSSESFIYAKFMKMVSPEGFIYAKYEEFVYAWKC